MNALREKFVKALRATYDTEIQLIRLLNKARAADNITRALFEQHFEHTEIHLERLRAVFEALGEDIKPDKYKAMDGLIETAEKLIKQCAPAAALIVAVYKIKQHKTASYASLISWAQFLGETEAIDCLGRTLQEATLKKRRYAAEAV
jgi:ferritin-like metal-binding protein YciE